MQRLDLEAKSNGWAGIPALRVPDGAGGRVGLPSGRLPSGQVLLPFFS